MGRLSFWALLLIACGKVAEIPADAPVDAPIDAFSCPASQLACDDTCVDPMTDGSNCGFCGNACTASEGCVAGHCTDMVMSCAGLLAINPTLPNGAYTFLDGTFAYCDMVNGGVTYRSLDYGQYNVAVAGEDLITPADLGSATLQQAFITLFNHQGGLNLVATWTATNCCFAYAPGATGRWSFGSNYLEPYTTAGVSQCDVPTNQTEAIEMLPIAGGSAALVTSIASTFFTTNAPGSATICGDNNNPGFFWKREMP